MTGKRRSNIYVNSESSSEESNGLDSDNFDEFQLKSNKPTVTSEIKPRKRGRGPSKRPCQNRNAMMARMNRQKKKEYLEKIEKKLSHYRDQHKNLKNIIGKQDIDLKRLKAEVSYLRNILNNNTAITALLKAMNEILRNKKCQEVDNQENKVNTSVTGVNCDSSTEFSTYEATNHTINEIDMKPLSSLAVDSVDLGVTDQEIEQLTMDNNIFDTINDSDVNADPIDFIRPDDGSIDTANLFENLDNSGVCVHVNSGRISLEFCSVCHLNSINSDDP
ncbi:uncharacterized protein [Chelonus insularis]|uniref:uncharacterized protein n=1 Tax=Chelonus insularis TaxID=460826 RepID=UPI00158A3B32|nr:uncharacterized protein LOC118063752 [Chelonus insularis]